MVFYIAEANRGGALRLCGHGRLRLTEPDEESGEPGIEVELSPAGKRIQRLSLLSGGEKALGAISFLFALFLARPCPFYLLDEVDMFLDAVNADMVAQRVQRASKTAKGSRCLGSKTSSASSDFP